MKTSRENKTRGHEIFMMTLACALIILSACTKKIPYETLPEEQKEKDVSRDLFDTNVEHLYSASLQNASRSAGEAFPFLAGDTKRVKIELAKESIRIIELEKDERFLSNATNNKLVLEIPVSYVQYGCKKDRFGECTNTEEENSKISWDQRDTVRIKLEEIKSGELELLPLLSSATVGTNCYENVSSRLVKSSIEKDAINFQIERVFKTKLSCLSDDALELSDATVSAIYHYSLLKTSAALSKDYEVVSYPEGSLDERSFGFFSSRRTRLDVDNNNTTNSTVQIMNRWNPNRKEIVYHLSDEFDKEENKKLKQLTVQAVENVNKGLEQAGVQFRINLKNPSGKIAGDIRNNMIILVEDPVASSVIGYGPQTEDPVTGEIVSARTVMFLGTIKKFAKQTYDHIIREKKAANLQQKGILSKAKVSGYSLASDITSRVSVLKETGKVFGASELMDKALAKIAKPVESSKAKDKVASGAALNKEFSFSEEKGLKAAAALRNYTARKNDEYSAGDLKSKIKYLQEAKNCAFAPMMEGASGAISEKLKAEFPADAKPWNELSEGEKQRALDIILPEIWVPTLVHELGHNLGLRHNFAGSEDKPNFYSSEELASMGVDHEVPFSSVMDYGNDLKTLPKLGRYDIAALRFGYARQVSVLKNDKEELMDVPSTLEDLSADVKSNGQTLKAFQYCTDEHTGINAGCKRFDLGTSYTEIVQNLIHDYETAYTSRNLRDGRASFSQMSDLAYFSRISAIFKELRIMMEVVERFKYEFNLKDDAPEWEQINFLKDLRQAAVLGGSYLAQVILLPDVQCAVALKNKPNEIIAIAPIADISKEALNCSDLALKEEYLVVGQAGKFINSKKDSKNRNPYVDQIDVRGIWLDKVAAVQTLTARTIDVSTMNKYTDNFLNMPELREGVLNAIRGVLGNNVVNKVTFTMTDGSKQDFEISYDMDTSQVVAQPFLLALESRSEDQKKRVAQRLGVNLVGTTPLKQILAGALARHSVDPNRVNTQDRSLKDLVSVYKFDAITDVKVNESAKRVVIDGVQYIADSSHVLAAETMDLLPQVRVMDQLNRESLMQVYNAKIRGQPLPEVPVDQQTDMIKKVLEQMKLVFEKIETETLQNYLLGVVKNEKFYSEQLQVLPAAN